VNISYRLRAGVVVGALCTVGISAQSIAAQAAQSPLNGPYCSGGQAVSGPGSTAQVNAIPGFNATLQAGGETDLLGNTVPGCAGESVTDTGGGSGAGTAAAVNHSAPISFSDDPLSPSNHSLATGGSGTNASPIHQVPVAVLPVSVIYNLPCWVTPLNLTSIDIAKMYDGVITTWDNALINVDNPGISSACAGVHVNLIARSDVSGTTFLFKSYLAHRNSEFQSYKQDALNTSWPAVTAGLNTVTGCAGTGGVISCVNGTQNSIGYAAASNVRKAVPPPAEAAIDDPQHTFSKWTAGSCNLAALTAPIPPTTLGNWSTVDFTDSPVPSAYTICGYTYDFVFQNYQTAFNGAQSVQTMQTIVDFLTAATSAKGQATLPADTYDQLPLPTQTVAQEAALDITYK